MPRDDARAWSKKIERIIKSNLGREEDAPKKEFSREYHDKVLEKIRRGKKTQD